MKDCIKDEQEGLRRYLKDKEEFYQRIRANR